MFWCKRQVHAMWVALVIAGLAYFHTRIRIRIRILIPRLNLCILKNL